VLEGSRDSVHWREYAFRWKPGDVTHRPGFVAPHQPRLDWQMWFAALDPAGAESWLGGLMRGVLEGTPQVVSLAGADAFPGASPARSRRQASVVAPSGRAGGHTSRASRPPGQSPVTTTDARPSDPPFVAARTRAWVLTNASIGWSSACQSSCPQSITQRPTRWMRSPGSGR